VKRIRTRVDRMLASDLEAASYAAILNQQKKKCLTQSVKPCRW
jgi:hypothetical protein